MSIRLPTDTAAMAPDDGPVPAHKSTIMLQYHDDDIGLEKRLLFEAATPAVALEIAAGEAAGRHARLFVDGTPLCSLLKADEDNPYWVVATSAGPPTHAPNFISPSPEELP